MYLSRMAMGIVVLALSTALTGQTETLNNDSILKMKTAGLSDETIVKAIQTSPGNYDTTASGLIALKNGGASDAILAAILNVKNPTPPTPSAASTASNGYPNELGVYYLKQDSYIPLEPEIMNIRTTNPLATGFTYGIKSQKINGWIVGKHSKNRFGSDIQTFFLDIAEGVSPAEYTLIRLHEKGDRREVELAHARWAAKTGVPEKAEVQFESKKIDKGKYKLTVSRLKPGEYGFMPPGAEISRNSTSVGKIYSFEVIE